MIVSSGAGSRSIRSIGWRMLVRGEAISGPLSARISAKRTPYTALSMLMLLRAANITLRLLTSSTTSAAARASGIEDHSHRRRDGIGQYLAKVCRLAP